MIEQYSCKSILDYGCGKAKFWPSHWQNIQGYDPAWHEFNIEPKPADMVICIDVLEHVTEQFVPTMLEHLNALANKCLYLSIGVYPAKKTFANGENCHVTVKPEEWWHQQLAVMDKPYQLKFG